jgi:hypothetical protein
MRKVQYDSKFNTQLVSLRGRSRIASLLVSSFLLVLFLFNSNYALAQSQSDENLEYRALFVEYFGGYTGFDRGGYKMLRSTIGQLVAEETLGTFITKEIGNSGGGSFCLELAINSEKKISEVASAIKSLHPSDGRTVFRYKEVKHCLVK